MRYFIVFLLLLATAGVSYAKEDKPLASIGQSYQTKILGHVWSSPRFSKSFWGVACTDVDGDSKQDVVILERNAVRVADFEDGSLNVKYQYEWNGFLLGVRLFTMNLDDDPAEEIIISAVEYGSPASFALDFTDGKLKPVFQNERWHLRALYMPEGELAGQKRLIGQQWNSSSFFAGDVYELAIDKGKLKKFKRVKLPGWAAIFDFAIYPSAETEDEGYYPRELVGLEGYAPLNVYRRDKKRFKKTWSSGQRFGGTMNIINAVEREPLGIANQEGIPIDREPQIERIRGEHLIFAIQHDIPLKNIVGRQPYIKSGNVTSYKSDPALGFFKYFETEEIPGFISDFAIYEGPVSPVVKEDKKAKRAKANEAPPPSVKKLIMAVQPNTSAFYESTDSALLIFDLP